MSYLREETKKRGFPTPDGVHMGPCDIHKHHAHTIGPDGSLYACPGFTGEPTLSTGHIDDRKESWRRSAAERFEHLAAWHKCGDCAFIPVCAGGCSVASHTELGDMNMPTCHKPASNRHSSRWRMKRPAHLRRLQSSKIKVIKSGKETAKPVELLPVGHGLGRSGAAEVGR